VPVNMETIVSRVLPVQVTILGDPPLGYNKGTPTHAPTQVTISGPISQVNKVVVARAEISITGASETIKSTVSVQALDNNSNAVSDVTITPKTVLITQPISLQGGFKNVVVKVVTRGQLVDGYRLTNISVTPPNITIFSSDPQLVNDIPGYVETMPVDLTHLTEDMDARVAVNLPHDVTLVGEQSVLVQVGVASIEGSLTIALPIETLGLPPQLHAQISPAAVEVIVSGPLPVLDSLTPTSFRAVIDLTKLAVGEYKKAPIVDLVPAQVRVQSVQPQSVDVEILAAPTPTATTRVLPGTRPSATIFVTPTVTPPAATSLP
jgi:YbbR domain-containing protein